MSYPVLSLDMLHFPSLRFSLAPVSREADHCLTCSPPELFNSDKVIYSPQPSYLQFHIIPPYCRRYWWFYLQGYYDCYSDTYTTGTPSHWSNGIASGGLKESLGSSARLGSNVLLMCCVAATSSASKELFMRLGSRYQTGERRGSRLKPRVSYRSIRGAQRQTDGRKDRTE